MKKLIVIFTYIVVALLLSACAGAFQRPGPSVNYGNPPQGYEEAIKVHFKQVLKDPESANYRFGKPVKAYTNEGMVYGGKVSWVGYLVDVQVNAKNSFGGYVGFKPYMLLFDGNNIVKYIEGSDHVLVHRME
ncbi:hypothetical protein [Sulfurimonas sp.]|uniref:hypothetical protein n=1 Tax=Sulfurimonas sp. TaxID=2022749 RepID=UPI0025F04EB9|nr:hypothetical protein [Sulfurimonas sp.]MCK9455360.1 hypothetical protein [Sulfurimonas sp.]